MGQTEINDARHSEEGLPTKTTTYRDADKALDFLRYNEADTENIVVDEQTLVRRIDWMIVPIMFACYFLQYLDKSLRMYFILRYTRAVIDRL